MIRAADSRHAFRRACLLDALREALDPSEYGPHTARMARHMLDELHAMMERDECPRCGGRLGEPVGSRATSCRCVPVCVGCSIHESDTGAWLDGWPLSGLDGRDRWEVG
jgi:hypothetical protein